MTVQTYCTRTDIENITGPASVSAAIDDDQMGVESVEDEAVLTNAIEWGANIINQHVRHQYYPLSSLASNEWLKQVNAELAVYRLRTRRNNPAEGSVLDNYKEIMRTLLEIRWGREQIPDQAPSFDHLPSVSNFQPQIGRGVQPIRVDEEESTTTKPVSGRKRFTADSPGLGF